MKILLFKPAKNRGNSETVRLFVVYHPITKCAVVLDVLLKERLLHDHESRILALKKYLNNEKINPILATFKDHIEVLKELKKESDDSRRKKKLFNQINHLHKIKLAKEIECLNFSCMH